MGIGWSDFKVTRTLATGWIVRPRRLTERTEGSRVQGDRDGWSLRANRQWAIQVLHGEVGKKSAVYPVKHTRKDSWTDTKQAGAERRGVTAKVSAAPKTDKIFSRANNKANSTRDSAFEYRVDCDSVPWAFSSATVSTTRPWFEKGLKGSKHMSRPREQKARVYKSVLEPRHTSL